MSTQGSFAVGLRTLVVFAGVFVLSAPAGAQTPKGVPTAPAADPMRGFGTNMAAGVLWGGGPDYKVRFEPGSIEFTPALGSRAPHDMPLTLAVGAVVRGDVVTPLEAVAPQREGDRAVLFDRAPAVVERHDVRVDGLELSWTFASRPAGTGDLVVQLGAQCELPGLPWEGGARFVLPGVGGVGVGAVSGRDAAGHEVAGAVRLAGA